MDFDLLSKYGIKFAPSKLCQNEKSALAAAEKIGYPIAMKAISPQVLHKSDRGGVIVGIISRPEAEKAYKLIEERYRGVKLNGILVQKMAGKSAVELIVGGKRDPQFGQLIMLGMGGIFVEVMRDVTFRVCPITREDAHAMVRELRSYPILAGARGRKPVDERALLDTLVSVSRLLEKENPREFDINPIMADENGCIAVDVRILP